MQLKRLTVGYADNARGKSTLAALLRSLATGNPVHLIERQRLGSTLPVHAVVDCSGTPSPAIFERGNWNRAMPEIAVFDEQFVAENVCSGLTVEAGHRQNLHEFVLGAQGVTLNRIHQQFVEQIEAHNRDIRLKLGQIPAADMGGLAIDEFIALPQNSDVDNAIAQAERALAAAQEKEPIRVRPVFEPFSLPTIDVNAIESLLGRVLPTLEASAAERVREHLASIGEHSEGWVAEGIHRIGRNETDATCPFCAQNTGPSPVIQHYQAYFSAEYARLKRDVAGAVRDFRGAHDGEAVAAFERAVRVFSESRQFWSRFCEVPEIGFETAAVVAAWRAARQTVLAVLEAKAASPLEPTPASGELRSAVEEYVRVQGQVLAFSVQINSVNERIAVVKQSAATGNVNELSSYAARLRTIKARYSSPTLERCNDYLAAQKTKEETERNRDAARTALDVYRVNAFPAYQTGVNKYLAQFGATFRLENVEAINSRGGTSCAYNVLVNNVSVPVAGGSAPGLPSFRTILSAGDRNTLALAFFFAAIDADPNRRNRVVVVDDPMSSLDNHRAITTAQHVRALMAETAQVIVLSHNKQFLCRIWEHADATNRSAFQVARDPNGSTIEPWDVDSDSVTEHDKRHSDLREFAAGRVRATSDIARCIRPTIEGFFRVSFPEHFPPATLLGVFRGVCDQRVGQQNEILDANDTRELREILEYANRFHHDTNPAWDREPVNDGELQRFVARTLAFARR